MKKKLLLLCLSAVSVGATTVFLGTNKNLSTFASLKIVPTPGTWYHFSEVEPTGTTYGTTEYWTDCLGTTQTEKPDSETIVEAGQPSAEQISAIVASDPTDERLVDPYVGLVAKKGKTTGAALDNVLKIKNTPEGTTKVEVSVDGGSKWIKVEGNEFDYTVYNKITDSKIKVRALDSSGAVLETKSVDVEQTYFVAGDAYFKESTCGIGINNDLGGGYYYKDDNTTKLTGANYWKAEHTGQSETNIKYKAIAAKSVGSFHAAARLHYINGGRASSKDAKVPGMTERMWINVDGYNYRLPENTPANVPFGIKKVALWAYFTNFQITFTNDEVMDVTKIYNKGFFMTPVVGTTSDNTITGYMESADSYSKIEGGLNAKTWKQFVYDVSDFTSTNVASFSTRYLQFTQTITKGTITGETGDMKTKLLGSTINGKEVKDFKFDVAMNAVQFVY